MVKIPQNKYPQNTVLCLVYGNANIPDSQLLDYVNTIINSKEHSNSKTGSSAVPVFYRITFSKWLFLHLLC
jgi:hypothetical protein